ncbi:Coq4 family protein [Neolewinella agarilytica]|uniref:Coenzyme Q (Ubiquinone) biosynthesis protein Coq4 n=1 Tax=Neolewinella agarilytica TaxID=478744 RepID=A0A1H9HVY8_9BACT|nr:Coq4 family protein [Neolewinella agarilytica]SEQ66516.1 Coenzyme Q (ubiquinone) biosynthesis protein Coq4 [Neolewinella agarilytica]
MADQITLREGLDIFQQKNKKFFSTRPMSGKARTFLSSHDIAHVVFGCDTTLYGEGVVKVWTTFGTTLSFWKVIRGYNEVNAFQLFRAYSFRHIAGNILRFLWAIPTVIIRSGQMKKPWAWSDYQPYLDKPIAEIREEFNIRVVE